MIVQIPDNIPEEVSDKIYMVTAAQDTVEYGFHVIVPKPMIASMSCEYATAGSEGGDAFGEVVDADGQRVITPTAHQTGIVLADGPSPRLCVLRGGSRSREPAGR